MSSSAHQLDAEMSAQHEKECAQQTPRWCVQELEGRGRGVVSTEVIPSGSVVLLECRPLVAAVHAGRARTACAHCMALRLAEVSTKFLDQPAALTCTGCGQAAWCSEECRNQSSVLGTHPTQICLAYKRLAERSAQAGDAQLDEEMQSDARMLFFAYYFRRYKPEEFARWSLLCSVDTKPVTSVAASGSSSSAAAASGSMSPASVSPEEAEEEQRIEELHDAVVDCLQYAARSIAEPATPIVTPTPSPPPTLDALSPPPALALPTLSKQFTDLHISHPSDDLTESLASDADLAVTRSLYLKLKCNGFALMAPNDKMGNRQTPRGYAIYTDAAMMNHSCMPSLARFDKIDQRDVKFTKSSAAASSSSAAAAASSSSASIPATLSTLPTSSSDCNSSASFAPLLLELRAMHTIPAYTELTISYVPLFWDRRERQSHIKPEYGFKCRCDRCRLEKAQERAELAAGGDDDDEEEHAHDHDDEDEDEDGEDGEDDDEEDEPLSEDDEADLAADVISGCQLSRGELNVYNIKYTCPSLTCGGTLAPVKQSGATPVVAAAPVKGKPVGESMECNVCGKVRTDAQFHRQLQKEFGLRK